MHATLGPVSQQLDNTGQWLPGLQLCICWRQMAGHREAVRACPVMSTPVLGVAPWPLAREDTEAQITV